MSAFKYLLALTIFSMCASSALAIHCYKCDSLLNEKCGSKFEGDEYFKVDCSRSPAPRFLQNILPNRNATGCMKQTLETVSGHPHITRNCYFGDISNTQVGCAADPTLPFVKQLSCNVCTDDLCNGSSTMAPIAVTILAFFALARVFS